MKVRSNAGLDAGSIVELVRVINSHADGKLDCYGSVTLTASAASTTVTDYRAGGSSIIIFMPTTAHAAADMNSMYVSARGQNTFTITHANNANTDRIFNYMVFN